jgi:transposase
MIPADHILRRIDGLIDLGELRDALAPHYSRRGRPSIAPELLVRMALIARLYGITSERRLCEEVRFNLAYRWFCRLPPDARVPHHSTFSKNRHGRFRDAGIFRILFEQTVRRCADARLIAASGLRVEVAALTGESEPIDCAVAPASPLLMDAHNIVFSSSLVLAGDAHAVVFRTGDDTYIGDIAHLSAAARAAESSMAREVRHVAYMIGGIALVAGLAAADVAGRDGLR